MHTTAHFQTSPLPDFPSAVKFTTIFQSPKVKTSECHLIFFFRYKILQILPMYFFVFYANTFPLSPFCFRFVWKSLNCLLHNSHLFWLYLILCDVTTLPKLDRQSYHFSPQNSEVLLFAHRVNSTPYLCHWSPSEYLTSNSFVVLRLNYPLFFTLVKLDHY